MPVVTPVAASIETVNPVASEPWLAGTISGRSSSSQRSSGSARQISPRAWQAMNAIACLGDELGRHAQVALVLAVGVVAHDDHPARLELSERATELAGHFGDGAHGRRIIAGATRSARRRAR